MERERDSRGGSKGFWIASAILVKILERNTMVRDGDLLHAYQAARTQSASSPLKTGARFCSTRRSLARNCRSIRSLSPAISSARCWCGSCPKVSPAVVSSRPRRDERSELLKTGDIRPHLLQPVEQIGEATIDAVDVVGRDPHDRSFRVAEPTLQALPRYRAIGNWSQDGGQPAGMGRAAAHVAARC